MPKTFSKQFYEKKNNMKNIRFGRSYQKELFFAFVFYSWWSKIRKNVKIQKNGTSEKYGGSRNFRSKVRISRKTVKFKKKTESTVDKGVPGKGIWEFENFGSGDLRIREFGEFSNSQILRSPHHQFWNSEILKFSDPPTPPKPKF